MQNKNQTHDWIHCNKCFRMKTSGVQFYCSDCSHVFCECCLATSCPVCSKQMKVLKMESAMPVFMKDMFSDVASYLDRLPKIVKFQFAQRSHLEEAKTKDLQELIEKHSERKRMKKGLELLVKSTKEEAYKVEKLKDYIAKLGRYHKAKSAQINMMQTPKHRRSSVSTNEISTNDTQDRRRFDSTSFDSDGRFNNPVSSQRQSKSRFSDFF